MMLTTETGAGAVGAGMLFDLDTCAPALGNSESGCNGHEVQSAGASGDSGARWESIGTEAGAESAESTEAGATPAPSAKGLIEAGNESETVAREWREGEPDRSGSAAESAAPQGQEPSAKPRHAPRRAKPVPAAIQTEHAGQEAGNRQRDGSGAPAAIGYIRVSTDGQAVEGVSLDAQRQRIAAWTTGNGYELAHVHEDAGISGKRADNRPGLQAALAEVCRTGGALVVYSLSRLARSTKDAIAIAERLDKAGADLVSLTEKIDTTSAAGKMVFRMLSVLNEFERDLASERTKAALAHKARKRERTGDVPYGFDLAPDRVHLTENPAEQATIARIREWRQAGFSLRDIAARLTAEHVPTKKGNATWMHQAVAGIIERISLDACTEKME